MCNNYPKYIYAAFIMYNVDEIAYKEYRKSSILNT